MDYIKVDIKVNPVQPASEIVISYLAGIGFESFVDTPSGVEAYVGVEFFDETAFMEIMSDLPFEVSHKRERIAHRNWNQEWENDYEPIWINENCIVRAPFHQFISYPKYDLIIEPQMSFGTGHHETTRLMIESMLEMDMKEKKILDMGAGTGVLAILAEKMGAKDIMAIEIEDYAAENCVHNAKLNNCVHVNVENGDSSLIFKHKFDVIFANINLNVILKDLSTYVDALNPGGHILMSGFYEKDQFQIIEPLVAKGLLHLKTKHINNWANLHFRK